MISHILEKEVKWILENVANKKAALKKILQDDAFKMMMEYMSRYEKQ